MTTLALDRRFECVPHATRSVAMALTLSLNFAIILFAILPNTPFTAPPPPPTMQATVMPPPPPAIVLPPAPLAPVVPHVATPVVHLTVPQPTSISIPMLPTIAPVAPVQATTPTDTVGAAVGNSSATIAYETATPPKYPVAALTAGIQGTVLLQVLVDPTGKPVKVLIKHSSGARALDMAALRHVLAAWRFHPAMRDGHAVEAWAIVPVQFNLNQL